MEQVWLQNLPFSSCNKQKHSLTSLIGTVKFLSDFFTEVHKYRLQCYYSDTGSLAPRWLFKYCFVSYLVLDQIRYIYRVTNRRSLGCLSEKFNVQRYWKLHKYLHPNRWLLDWTRREIQALTQVPFCTLKSILHFSISRYFYV